MESIDSPNSNDEQCYSSLINSQRALGNRITQLQNRLDTAFHQQTPCRSQTDAVNSTMSSESNILVGDSYFSLENSGSNLVRNKGSISSPTPTEGADDDCKLPHRPYQSEKSAEVKQRRARRRRSTLSFLDFVFQTDDHKTTQDFLNGGSSDNEESSHEEGCVSSGGDIDFEPLDFRPGVCEIEDFRQHLLLLHGATRRSQKSQIEIHAWDRKMGLRANHSSTMRKSSRSRRKIKGMVKRELKHLRNIEC